MTPYRCEHCWWPLPDNPTTWTCPDCHHTTQENPDD